MAMQRIMTTDVTAAASVPSSSTITHTCSNHRRSCLSCEHTINTVRTIISAASGKADALRPLQRPLQKQITLLSPTAGRQR
jgi:hypothetical protein